jgi:hypothetical protein
VLGVTAIYAPAGLIVAGVILLAWRSCLTGAPEHGEPPEEAYTPSEGEERADLALGFQDWVNMFQFGGSRTRCTGATSPTAAARRSKRTSPAT